MEKDKKGFTLIELIAILVSVALFSLLATPLVMSIIRIDKLIIEYVLYFFYFVSFRRYTHFFFACQFLDILK